jgi:hypothetical protein
VTAPIASGELLEIAELLADQDDPAYPRPTHLRRAISSAYYALFHELVREAVAHAVGDSSAKQAEREAVARWYNHSEIRVVSRWVVSQAQGRKLPDPVIPLLANPPADWVAVADAFNDLHDARHEADYDHAATITQQDARNLISLARDAIGRLQGLRGDRVYDSYLLLLLGGPRVASR